MPVPRQLTFHTSQGRFLSRSRCLSNSHSITIEHGELGERAFRRPALRGTADVQGAVPPTRQSVASSRRGQRGHDEEPAKDLRRYLRRHVDRGTGPTGRGRARRALSQRSDQRKQVGKNNTNSRNSSKIAKHVPRLKSSS